VSGAGRACFRTRSSIDELLYTRARRRPNVVSISMARQFGFGRVTAKSTGNHGDSVAAYAGAAGLDATILCHEDTSELQLALMESYGARVTQILSEPKAS